MSLLRPRLSCRVSAIPDTEGRPKKHVLLVEYAAIKAVFFSHVYCTFFFSMRRTREEFHASSLENVLFIQGKKVNFAEHTKYRNASTARKFNGNFTRHEPSLRASTLSADCHNNLNAWYYIISSELPNTSTRRLLCRSGAITPTCAPTTSRPLQRRLENDRSSRRRDPTDLLARTKSSIGFRLRIGALKLPFRPRVRLYVFCRADAISQRFAGTRRRLLRKSWLIVSPDTILAQRRSIATTRSPVYRRLTNTGAPEEPPPTRRTSATNGRSRRVLRNRVRTNMQTTRQVDRAVPAR